MIARVVAGLVCVAVAAVAAYSAIALNEVAQAALVDVAYPTCGWMSGQCRTEYVQTGVAISGAVVFGSLYAILFGWMACMPSAYGGGWR